MAYMVDISVDQETIYPRSIFDVNTQCILVLYYELRSTRVLLATVILE
jgi:hypothetical protein